MASFNRVILLGNLTRDPEVRYTPSGTAVTEIGLAVNRSWFDKQTNTRREETDFFDVTLWARLAEIAGEYLSKGRPVLIEGRLQLDQWEDRESGKKRSKVKIIGENMQMLGGRSESGRPSSGSSQERGPSEGGSQVQPDYPSDDFGSSAPQPPRSDSPPSDSPPSDSPPSDSPPSGPTDNVPF